MKPEDVTTPRRRSARLSEPEEKPVDKPVVTPVVAQRKTFTLKKIVPRKTQVAELNKENDGRLSNIPEKRPKVSSPAPEKKTKASTPSSERTSKRSTPASEKRPKQSTPAAEKRPKQSTPAAEKRPKQSTPAAEKRPKQSTPAAEKKPKQSTPAAEKKPKVSTSSSSSEKRRKVSVPAAVEQSPKMSTPAPVDGPPPRPSVLSPIVAPQGQSPPRPAASATRDDETWSQKVRRSYSRLSGDASFASHHDDEQRLASSSPAAGRRETLFGFEKMPTPKVFRTMSVTMSVSAPQASSSMCGVSSLNLSEAEDSLNRSGEPDLNIPGVARQKKHAKRKKVQPITMSELDVLAAQMNAEFAEAESFELVVE